MTTIITRAGKGTPLTNDEMDTNLTNLNTDKVELSALADTTGSSLVGFKQSGTGAVNRTVTEKLSEVVSVRDFGAVGDGITDDTAAIQAAIANGAPIYFPPTSTFYKISSPIIFTIPFIAGMYKVFEAVSGNVKFTIGTVPVIYPQWWGALGNNSHDDTTAIQAALDSVSNTVFTIATNEASYTTTPIHLVSGAYKISSLLIDKPTSLIGDGMYETVLRTTVPNGKTIRITTDLAIEIKDLSIGSYDSVTQVSPSIYLSLESDTINYNEYSIIQRVGFHNAYTAVSLTGAAFTKIVDCYFNAGISTGIVCNNLINVDEGDFLFAHNTFNNGGNRYVAIKHIRSGGLRIIDNKFLGGLYHYLSEFSGVNTGQLQIVGNSFDQIVHNGACIAFNTTGAVAHSIIIIERNIFMSHYAGVGTTQWGIYSANIGSDYLFNMSIGHNVFYVYDGGTGIFINGMSRSVINPNLFIGQVGITTGINFGDGTGPNLILPQTMWDIDTKYTGISSAEKFVSGEYRTNAGTPVNTISPNYIGEECLDTTNKRWYKSYGMDGTTWVALN